MRYIALACALTCAAADSPAAEKVSPVEQFHENTTAQLLICRIQMKTALLKSEAGEGKAFEAVSKCVKDGRMEAKKSFQPALRSVSKMPTASRLLKEYFAVWLAAFEGLMPNTDELVVTYEQRQASAEIKADEAWNRFEVEAGL